MRKNQFFISIKKKIIMTRFEHCNRISCEIILLLNFNIFYKIVDVVMF